MIKTPQTNNLLPVHVPQTSNNFVMFGPLIATMLTILYGHLVGIYADPQFGRGINFEQIREMIVLTLPMTVCAYILGSGPAWVTSRIYRALITKELLNSLTLTLRSLLIGGLSGVVWLIVAGAIAVIAEKNILACVGIIGAVVLPTSMICAYIESRVQNHKK